MTLAVTLPFALLMALAIPARDVSPSARVTSKGVFVPGWVMVILRVVPVVSPSKSVLFA